MQYSIRDTKIVYYWSNENPPSYAGHRLLLCYCVFVHVSVRPCVRVQNIYKILKSTSTINFIFGGSLPCDPGRTHLILKKKKHHPEVRVGVGRPRVGVVRFRPNDKRWEHNFWVTIIAKRWETILDTNRKSYMENPTAPLHFTLKGQIQGHWGFEALYLVKEPR